MVNNNSKSKLTVFQVEKAVQKHLHQKQFMDNEKCLLLLKFLRNEKSKVDKLIKQLKNINRQISDQQKLLDMPKSPNVRRETRSRTRSFNTRQTNLRNVSQDNVSGSKSQHLPEDNINLSEDFRAIANLVNSTEFSLPENFCVLNSREPSNNTSNFCSILTNNDFNTLSESKNSQFITCKNNFEKMPTGAVMKSSALHRNVSSQRSESHNVLTNYNLDTSYELNDSGFSTPRTNHLERTHNGALKKSSALHRNVSSQQSESRNSFKSVVSTKKEGKRMNNTNPIKLNSSVSDAKKTLTRKASLKSQSHFNNLYSGDSDSTHCSEENLNVEYCAEENQVETDTNIWCVIQLNDENLPTASTQTNQADDPMNLDVLSIAPIDMTDLLKEFKGLGRMIENFRTKSVASLNKLAEEGCTKQICGKFTENSNPKYAYARDQETKLCSVSKLLETEYNDRFNKENNNSYATDLHADLVDKSEKLPDWKSYLKLFNE